MDTKKSRRLFSSPNNFQKYILLGIVFSFLFGCSIAWLTLVYFSFSSMPMGPSDFQRFIDVIPGILAILTMVMMVVLVFVCDICNKVSGPHQRILRELDEMIASKQWRPLRVRKEDVLFAELLERINKIFEEKNKAS